MKQSICPSCNKGINRFFPLVKKPVRKKVPWYKPVSSEPRIVCSHCDKYLEYRVIDTRLLAFFLIFQDFFMLPRVWKENQQGFFIIVIIQLGILILLFSYQIFADCIYKVSKNQE